MQGTESNIRQALANAKAIITDSHFVYTKGGHGDAYINKDAIYVNPLLTGWLSELIADRFVRADIELVVSPAIGAVVLGNMVAYHLSQCLARTVEFVYAEKASEGFALRRGYDKVVLGKRVLVVEDLFNTGGSARQTVELVRAHGGIVAGVGAIANRGGVTAQDLGDVPKAAWLVDIPMRIYDPAHCPLCKMGMPINTELGHGREFLARQRA